MVATQARRLDVDASVISDRNRRETWPDLSRVGAILDTVWSKSVQLVVIRSRLGSELPQVNEIIQIAASP